jgi:hypothetical protein
MKQFHPFFFLFNHAKPLKTLDFSTSRYITISAYIVNAFGASFMLNMTRAEIRLRRNSLLIWRRYTYDNRYNLTCENVPVRLLCGLGDKLDENNIRDRSNQIRVLDPVTKRVHSVDPHFLIDPTRSAAPVVTYTPPATDRQIDRYKAARDRLRNAGRR